MMFTCSSCFTIWGAQLQACARCGSELHAFGSEEGDFTLPQIQRFPMRRAMRREVAGVPVMVPKVRDSIELWRRYALATGHPAPAVAEMTKVELMSLAGRYDDDTSTEAVHAEL